MSLWWLIQKHWHEFLFLGTGLLALLYTMRIIKNENQNYLKNPQQIFFGDLILSVPRWWTPSISEPDHLEFSRTDTRYDWRAIFKIERDCSQSLENYILEYGLEEKIVFDQETTISKSPHLLFLENGFISQVDQYLRFEGTATQDQEERIYIDLILLKKGNDIWHMESRSSVLHGLVEGPYFESAISQLRPTDSD